MKKLVLILIPVVLLCVLICFVLCMCNYAQTGRLDIAGSGETEQIDDSVLPSEDPFETTDNEDAPITDPTQSTTLPTMRESETPDETTSGTGSTVEQEQGSDDSQNQDSSDNQTGYMKPEKTILQIGDTELKITGDSDAKDLLKRLGMEYRMTANTEGMVKINTYRSVAQDGMSFGAINTLEYDLSDGPVFCGVSVQLQASEDKELSIMGVTGSTTYNELIAMYGEPNSFSGYGSENMCAQTIYVGDETVMLITYIDPDTGCVQTATVTFW